MRGTLARAYAITSVEMLAHVRPFAESLKEEALALRRRALVARDQASRDVLMLRANQLEDAIDRLLIGAALEVAALRAARFR